MTRSRAVLFLIVLHVVGAISACGDSEATPPGRTPAPPVTSGASTGTSTGPSTTGTTAVDSTVVCAEDDLDGGTGGPGSNPGENCYCAADFVVGGSMPETYTCRAACVPTGAIGLWCWDDSSCCDDDDSDGVDPVCRPDGFCDRPGSADTGSDSTTGTGSTSDSTSDTTGSTSGTTGSTSGTTDSTSGSTGSGTTSSSSGTDTVSSSSGTSTT